MQTTHHSPYSRSLLRQEARLRNGVFSQMPLEHVLLRCEGQQRRKQVVHKTRQRQTVDWGERTNCDSANEGTAETQTGGTSRQHASSRTSLPRPPEEKSSNVVQKHKDDDVVAVKASQKAHNTTQLGACASPLFFCLKKEKGEMVKAGREATSASVASAAEPCCLSPSEKPSFATPTFRLRKNYSSSLATATHGKACARPLRLKSTKKRRRFCNSNDNRELDVAPRWWPRND